MGGRTGGCEGLGRAEEEGGGEAERKRKEDVKGGKEGARETLLRKETTRERRGQETGRSPPRPCLRATQRKTVS